MLISCCVISCEWWSLFVVHSGSGWEQSRVSSVTHLILQLANQRQMFHQSLEMQRQHTQAQMETLTNLGAAQVAKTTNDARDFQTKAFAKMKGFRGHEKAWRLEAATCFHQAAAILDCAEDRYDQPISESDIQQVAAKENWVDMRNFNMQLHGDLVSLMEGCTEGFAIVRNTKTAVALDA